MLAKLIEGKINVDNILKENSISVEIWHSFSTVMCHGTEAVGVAKAVFILSFYFEELQTIFGIVFIVPEDIFF